MTSLTDFRCTVLSTIGDRAFLAAAASAWNSLPKSVRALPSLSVFCSRLKTELFLLDLTAHSDYTNITLYCTALHWLLRDSLYTVTCPCSFRTSRHDTRIHSSSSLSSSSGARNSQNYAWRSNSCTCVTRL